MVIFEDEEENVLIMLFVSLLGLMLWEMFFVLNKLDRIFVIYRVFFRGL